MKTIRFAAEIARLLSLPLVDLRAEWHRHHPGSQMPERLPRDLLVRAIAWNLQEREHGAFPAALTRRLERLSGQLSRSGTLDIEREVSLKAGTRLLREWHGKTCRVTVLEEGYLFEDRRYASLSHIARAITGARWSGPRFFGLKQRQRRGSATEPGNGDV